ncbi:MAG: TIGR01620 family protein [Pseudomonadota bacterium]
MTKKPTARTPRSFEIGDRDTAPEKPARAAEGKRKETATPRKPTAAPASKAVLTPDETDYFALEAEQQLNSENIEAIEAPAKNSGFSFFALARWAFGFLLALAAGLWLENLWRTSFARNELFGWAVAGLIGLFLLAVIGIVIREWIAIRRIARVNTMRQDAIDALDEGNSEKLAGAARALQTHFTSDPNTAKGRARLAELKGAVLDTEDLYALHEKELLKALDEKAVATISAAAKRVSVVTAISPRALVDIGYVLYENIRLIRSMAELYGGRAGGLGTINLARRVVSHLALTGAISVGEGILQQIFGQGLAARISTRLGEGVINGVMTARIGIAAMEVCRPAPFFRLNKPTVSDFLPRLIPAKKSSD